jgi:hypothetical protein
MSTDFHYQIDAASGGDSIGAVDRSRGAFAISNSDHSSNRKKFSAPVLSRPQFLLARSQSLNSRARRFQERDSILSHKPAPKVVPVK